MIKKYLITLLLLLNTLSSFADEVQDQVVELQKSEVILLDNIYDHRDYATELWNSIVKNPGKNSNREDLERALVTLQKAQEIGALLLEVQNQLITFYTKYDKNEQNLSTAHMNRKITENLLTEISKFNSEFLTLKSKLATSVDTPKAEHKKEPGINKWTSIPWISDKEFREKIYDYYSGGLNQFIHKKPVVLLFYNFEQEPSLDQLLNIEDVYEKYRDQIEFYRVSYHNNKELIKVFQVESLPTIYYLNTNGELKSHTGNRGFYDIDQMIQNHMVL